MRTVQVLRSNRLSPDIGRLTEEALSAWMHRTAYSYSGTLGKNEPVKVIEASLPEYPKITVIILIEKKL